jgi:hypothetical protein
MAAISQKIESIQYKFFSATPVYFLENGVTIGAMALSKKWSLLQQAKLGTKYYGNGTGDGIMVGCNGRTKDIITRCQLVGLATQVPEPPIIKIMGETTCWSPLERWDFWAPPTQLSGVTPNVGLRRSCWWGRSRPAIYFGTLTYARTRGRGYGL